MILESLTILMLGDSHLLGEMGKTVQAELAKKNTVHMHAVCGSSTRGWILGGARGCQNIGRTEAAGFLVAKYKPDLTIISLGSNNLRNGTALTTRETRELLSHIPGKCIWIGPPDMRVFTKAQFKDFYAGLVDGLVGKCQLIDSEVLTEPMPQGGDGIHYFGASGRNWGMKVLSKLL